LLNKDGKGPMELFKGENLDEMLLKFIPLWCRNIYNLIVSLKHYHDNPSSLDYILKLKVLFGYNHIKNNYYLGQ
jgi:hypothetical protein